MTMKREVEKLQRMEEQARLGEGQKALDKQHAAGKLTARERIDLLFDQGTFVEMNMFAQHQCHDFGMENRRPLGDGVVTGYGKVEGRTVFVYAQDFTVLGGTVGHIHAAKICSIMELATKTGAPIVGLVDTAGARIQEGTGTYGYIFAENVMASGVVPQISAVMGNCAGGGVYSPALTDFIFMVEGTAQMFITGPGVIKEVTGEEITMEELGGAKVQSQISGNCDVVAKNDEDCLKSIRKLLSFLPGNFRDKPPVKDTGDDPNRCDEGLLNIVPDNPRGAFDMKKVITAVVDNGDFYEIKARFARNMITGFARLGGYPVGIVANQPLVGAGALDCDASDKAAHFYRTCDCFNVPIICLVDVPGYMPGVKEERKGIIRHGAKMLYGLREATVPIITCIVRKAYGGSIVAMGSKSIGADIVFAWPSAEIAIMGADGAVKLLYRKEIEEAADREQLIKQKMEEYRDTFSTPYYAASKQYVDVVIRPDQTRPYLIKALDVLWDKKVEFPPRKHGNIPL
jgi:acetyl-CoA carboxylase carboxyltransferase component